MDLDNLFNYLIWNYYSDTLFHANEGNIDIDHMIWAILGVRDKGILFKPIPVEAGSGFVLSTPMAKQKSNGVLVVSSQVFRADQSKLRVWLYEQVAQSNRVSVDTMLKCCRGGRRIWRRRKIWKILASSSSSFCCRHNLLLRSYLSLLVFIFWFYQTRITSWTLYN